MGLRLMGLRVVMQGLLEKVRPISTLREQWAEMNPKVQLEEMGRGRRQYLRNAKLPLQGLFVIHRQFLYACRGLGDIPLDQGGQRVETTGIYM